MDKNSQVNQLQTERGNDLTVVIPTYNRSQELTRALDSLVAQTDSDFDVIVCDDGSTEDIAAVTRKYAETLRLRLLRIEKSGGPGRARNLGIESAHTTWVSFLDSDDWWFPTRTEKVKASLTTEDDVVHHQLQVERADKNTDARPAHGSLLGDPLHVADPVMHMIRFGNPLATSATTVRRDLLLEIGGFVTAHDLIEDFDAWLRLANRGARWKRIPEVLGAYWAGGDQLSKVNAKQYQRYKNLFDHQLTLLPERYRAHAQSNFGYLLGSYALQLGLPSAQDHFRQISLAKEPRLWGKAKLKQWRMKLRSLFDK